MPKNGEVYFYPLVRFSCLIKDMGTSALLVKHLSKAYPLGSWTAPFRNSPHERQALVDISFDIGEGEVVGLIGPNSAGKSTLIRILAGILLPSSGSARLGADSLVRDRSDVRKLVGIGVTDDRGLSPRLTLEENLRFFGSLYGMSGNQVLQRMNELEGPLEVGRLRQRRIQTLSSGERARATLMRLYLHHPKLVLLDELTRSLDPGVAPRIRKWISTDSARQGTAVLFASHDLAEVRSTATRVLLLSEGRVAAFAPYPLVEPTAERVFLH